VMTTSLGRNYRPGAPSSDPRRFDMPAETFGLTIGGLDGRAANLSATDPLTGSTVPVDVTGRAPGSVTVSLPVTDSPRLLTIQAPPPVEAPTQVQRQPSITRKLTLGRLAISPRVFIASARGGSISRLTGTDVSYSLSGPALASFRVERYVRRGHRHRYVRLRGHFSHGSQSGVNSFRFTGRLRHRPLPGGRYRLVAVARNSAGQKTVTRRASFRVLP
jgi:hypothetical protein